MGNGWYLRWAVQVGAVRLRRVRIGSPVVLVLHASTSSIGSVEPCLVAGWVSRVLRRVEIVRRVEVVVSSTPTTLVTSLVATTARTMPTVVAHITMRGRLRVATDVAGLRHWWLAQRTLWRQAG
jgi:hypothetical protein